MQVAIELRNRGAYATPIGIGLWAALIGFAPTTSAKLIVAAPLLFFPIAWWSWLKPQRWLLLFLCSLALLPPLPIPLGDSGPHPALACFAFGLFICASRLHKWKGGVHPAAMYLVAFTAVLFLSVLSAAITSGTEIAIGSLFRVMLFAIGPFVFLYASSGPGSNNVDSLRTARILFRTAIAGALFACADFYFQFPAPAGFGAQFIWLDEGVFRRAQGFFYEASTLGNFCAFFLVMVLAALRRPRGEAPCSRVELTLGALVLSMAMVLSYSRASILNVIAAALTLAVLARKDLRRSAIVLGICGAVCLAIVYFAFPSFAESYFWRLFGSLKYILSSPNGVLSGRVDTWTQLTHFLAQEPWRLFLGIGYKTLAYSQVAGSAIIADNTYLSVLIETGVLGISVFLLLNWKILQTSLRAARSSSATQAFFGTWMLCFWVGELVQMMSGDLITYWRVLPFYFWVLAQIHRSDSTPKPIAMHEPQMSF